MLRTMLWQAGLSPSDYYLTNVVKCRPPGNRVPTKYEIARCTKNYLIPELRQIRPNVIVAVGETALRFFLPDAPAGVTQVRGHIFTAGEFGKLLPIVHPSFVARGNPEYWAITVTDLKKAKQHSQSDELAPREERFILSPSLQDVTSTIDHLIANRLAVAFDIETIGELEQTNILCVGLAWSPADAMCVPFLRRGGYPYWHNEWEELKAWEALCNLFTSDCLKITQNGFTFDLPVLMDLGVKFKRGTVVDTLIKHHIVATELPHSLAFLTSIYTDLPYYKSDVRRQGGMLWAPDEVVRRYNVLDCVATYIANFQLDSEMKELGLSDGVL
jgi:uracil-DNA glycosylase family 4